MFCPKCGTQNPDGARFCGGCGNELLARAVPAGAAATTPAASTAPVAPMAVAAAAPQAAAYQPAVKKRSSLVPIIIGAAALVIAGFVVYTMFFAPYSVDDKTFPDPSLRMAVSSQFDRDGDGKITRDEAKAVASLNLSGSGVTSLDGLQIFENLHSLDLTGTSSLIQADFSKVKNLTELNLAGSALVKADISPISDLQALYAGGAGFTELDVSKNKKLTALRLDNGVAVSGLESTGLREQYLMAYVTSEGFSGAYDGQGGGAGVDKYEYEFTYDDDNNLTARNMRTEYTYNGKTTVNNYGARYTYEKGRLKTAESTGSYNTTISYEHDDSGNMVRATSVYHGSSSNSTTTYKLGYNDRGKLVSMDTIYSSSTGNRSISYNDAGQYTGSTSTSSGSSYTSTSEIFYDSAGRISSAKSDYMEMVFSYNDAGKLVSKTVYWLNKGVREGNGNVTSFSYDELGRVAQASRVYTYDNYTVNYTGSIEYDSHGNVAKVRKHYESTYANSTPMDGTQTFTYKRVFTAKEAPDVVQPMMVGDPSHYITANYPWQPGLVDASHQSEIAVCGLRVVDYLAITV